MVSDKNIRYIQLKIFSIAIIGGIAFSIYFYFNSVIAKQNEIQVEEIISSRFSDLQKATVMPGYVKIISQQLGDAIGLEDLWLLDQTKSLAKVFHDDLKSLTASYENQIKATSDNVQEQLYLPNYFDEYFRRNYEIAKILIENPDLFDNYIQEFHSSKDAFEHIEAYTNTLSKVVIDSYHVDLKDAQTLMHKSIQFGLIGGLSTAILLVLIAGVVSRNVGSAMSANEQLKNDFLATISHELRTPLNGINGALNLLKLSHDPEDTQSLIYTAGDSTAELSRMIDDILLFAELRSTNTKFESVPFDRKQYIIPILKKMNLICLHKGITLKHDIRMPELYEVHAHWPGIVKMIQTLLSNSCKFTKHGQIDLDIKVDTHLKLVNIVVSDTGVGISAENQKQLFKSFHQLDSSFDRKQGGLGLGLATLWMLTKSLGGKVDIESIEGKGTRFLLSIPVVLKLKDIEVNSVSANDASQQDLIQPPKPLPVTEPVKFKQEETPVIHNMNEKPHLLVVEDNAVNQMVIGSFIKKLGCSFTCVGDGQQALNWLSENKNKAQCILMDCQMPVMDGFTATSMIRTSDDVYAQIPIIAVTANAMAQDQAKCLEVGMNDYLKKPLELEDLKEKLNKYNVKAS